MPTGWTRKDQRQFEHIRKSVRQQGKSPETAREVAARTVNKQRREDGKTPQATTQGTGNPNKSLDQRSRQELYNRARQLGINGRSKLNKAGLIAAIRERQS